MPHGQLDKPLLGQYRFIHDSDRSDTLGHLGVGGVAVEVAPNVDDSISIDASASSLFHSATLENNGAVTVANSVDGQVIHFIVETAGSYNLTFVGATTIGVLAGTTASGADLFTIFNVGGVLFVTQNVVLPP